MSRKKKPAVPAFDADGAMPMLGGAFVRLPDGSLARDTSEDQHIPDDEDSEPGEPLTGTGEGTALPPIDPDKPDELRTSEEEV